ncbi:DinB family protein [Candidatus Lokiarchaeum ossiferum]|uniref:DinB family protein n=1 Tax=Candidatus Lokiarchaeum ossiferum TaxID=2951803 RepID=UPI00352E2EBC
MSTESYSLILKMPKYNKWANDQIRNMLEVLPEEKFDQNLGNLFVNDTNFKNPSIRSLIEHCMMGFYFTSNIMQKKEFEPEQIIKRMHTLNKTQLLKEWEQLDTKYVELIPQHLNTEVEWNEKSIKLNDDFLFTFLNHSTHHRAQLMVAMRMIGENGCDTDYMSFIQSFSD